MHSPFNSLRKRLYTMRLDSRRSESEWAGCYWIEEPHAQAVHCSNCRKFSPARVRCSVPFGTPLRKCVTAALEANLCGLHGKSVLEIGYGKHSVPRRLTATGGGRWTGIDPSAPQAKKARLGGGGFGVVGDLPFPDDTFDVVVGVQTFEHWADRLADPKLPIGHEAGLNEVFRVLKPGGTLYLDAPIHLHGHEMFIVGDLDRIRALFHPARWENLTFQKWRQQHEPLERYPTPDRDKEYWARSVTSYRQELLDDIADNGSVWLLTIRARKAGSAAASA